MLTKYAVSMFLGLSIVCGSPETILGQEPKAREAPKGETTDRKASQETPGQAVSRLAAQIKLHPVKPKPAKDRLALYMIDVENGELTLIADQPDPGSVRCGSPEWSHDGKRIIYDAVAMHQLPLTHLKVIELVKGELKVNDIGLGNCPTFAPNDDRVAFLNNSNAGGAELGVWLMRADGSERRLLGDYGRPKWSPDSRQFMIVNFTLPRQVTLMDARPDRSGPLQLGGQHIFPEPSWVGDALIVAAIGPNAPDSIALIDVHEPGQAKIKKTLWKKGKELDVMPYHPVYLDGKPLCVFAGEGAKGMALYAFEVGKPGLPRRLERQGHDTLIQDLAFSPDGRYVLFSSDRPGTSKNR